MKTVGSFLSFAALASAVCHYGTTLAPRDSLVGRAEGKFGYDGLQGPINWHGLSPSNALCARGKSQSPVNIVPSDYDTVSGSSYNLEIPSYPDGAEIENLGTGVQVYVNGSAIVGDTTYALQQYHFHTPSEHRIGSEYYPMEVHFVMQANDKSLAVIGFMIEVAADCDTPSEAMTASLRKVGEIPGTGNITTTEPLDFSDLQSHLAKSEVFTYGGSLTTAPCDEGVAWNVVADPIFIDVSTFRAVKKVLKFNSRYTQNAPGHMNLIESAHNAFDNLL